MILFKFATRSRPYQFLGALSNIQATISKGQEYKILVSADIDDETMNVPDLIQKANEFKNIIWDWGKSRNKVHAINRGMEKAGAWDILINMSDDMEFQFPDWDIDMLKLIREKWGNSTDWFAHFNDGYTENKIPSMSIIGWDYYDRFHRIYPQEYRSLWADNHVMDEAKLLARYKYFDLVFFKHRHPANEGIPQDDLYMKNEMFYYIDKATYEQFKLKNFGI